MQYCRRLSACALSGLLLTVAACGKSDYTPVSGVVLLDGEPVYDASISFIPTQAGGDIAHGFTDDSGRFWMYTKEEGDGVKPGVYKVIVSATGPPPEGVRTISDIMAEKYAKKNSNINVHKALNESKKAAAAHAKKPKIIPPLYADRNKTPLVADVPAQTDYKFELTKDPGAVKADDNSKATP